VKQSPLLFPGPEKHPRCRSQAPLNFPDHFYHPKSCRSKA